MNKKAIIEKMWEIHRNSENLEQCWNAIFESIIKPKQRRIKSADEIISVLSKDNIVLAKALDSKNIRTILKEFAEKLTQTICNHTYPDFDKNGKPVNVWNAITGFDCIDQTLKEFLGEQGNV